MNVTRTLLLASLCLPVSAFAATLSGNLVFDKKAPYTGVLYANGGKGPASAQLDQSNKVFDKNVLVVGAGGKITFKNSDNFQHNIFANDPNTNVKFDVGLMEQGQSKEINANWQENTMTRIGCKIHPKMRSYIANVNSDAYHVFPFAKGTKDYPVSLDVGSHTEFTLSIPKYDAIKVNLAPGESKTIDVTRKGKKRATLTLALN